MKARVYVTLKNGVLDPQGKAISSSLNGLGFGGVKNIKQGKMFEVELAESDEIKAKTELEKICQKMLANTVIENYEFELVA